MMSVSGNKRGRVMRGCVEAYCRVSHCSYSDHGVHLGSLFSFEVEYSLKWYHRVIGEEDEARWTRLGY